MLGLSGGCVHYLHCTRYLDSCGSARHLDCADWESDPLGRFIIDSKNICTQEKYVNVAHLRNQEISLLIPLASVHTAAVAKLLQLAKIPNHIWAETCS